MDEIHISDDESEYQLHERSKHLDISHADTSIAEENSNIPSIVLSGEPTSNTQLRKLSVSNSEMEQYLFGYGENYGQLSSDSILEESKSKSKVMPAGNANDDDINSVGVLTSLGSSQSDLHRNDEIAIDIQLPTELESLTDQVRRLRTSIEKQEKTTNKVSSRLIVMT